MRNTGAFHKNMEVFRCEICVVEQLCNGERVLKWCVVQITLDVRCDDTVFLHKTCSILSLKPAVEDFIVLVFCESVSGLPLLGSIGKNKRLMLRGISSFRSEWIG